MKSEIMTDEQVEEEIAILQQKYEVKLAEKEIRLRFKRRKYLYNLRTYEKRGKELMEAGITLENIEEVMFSAEEESEV